MSDSGMRERLLINGCIINDCHETLSSIEARVWGGSPTVPTASASLNAPPTPLPHLDDALDLQYKGLDALRQRLQELSTRF